MLFVVVVGAVVVVDVDAVVDVVVVVVVLPLGSYPFEKQVLQSKRSTYQLSNHFMKRYNELNKKHSLVQSAFLSVI